MAVACMVLSTIAIGQTLSGTAGSANKALSPSLPSFASMGSAVRNQDYTVEQIRRFRDESGVMVSVRERLEVNANGSAKPEFAITFLGVDGEPAGSSLNVEWQNAYNRFGTLFFRHGSFHVRDTLKASANYTLHDFGQVVSAGRLARRTVVFPATIDKSIWIIDFDAITSIPLFVAEFDHQLNLFSNIEVVSFTASVQAFTPTVPTCAVTSFPDYTGAAIHLGSPSGLLDPDVMLVPDYSLDRVEIHDDPINGRQKLVMSYTDGIDQFMVVQGLNSLDPFAGMPSSAGGANTIARFRDPSVSALVFWDDQVTFHVAGRGSLQRLDDVARRIYLQALLN
jgi:hypothetical protein